MKNQNFSQPNKPVDFNTIYLEKILQEVPKLQKFSQEFLDKEINNPDLNLKENLNFENIFKLISKLNSISENEESKKIFLDSLNNLNHLKFLIIINYMKENNLFKKYNFNLIINAFTNLSIVNASLQYKFFYSLKKHKNAKDLNEKLQDFFIKKFDLYVNNFLLFLIDLKEELYTFDFNCESRIKIVDEFIEQYQSKKTISFRHTTFLKDPFKKN